MFKILFGFIVFFVLTFFGYKYISELDDNELEMFTSKGAIIATCGGITIALVSLVVLSF
jgi:hypothetical protein